MDVADKDSMNYKSILDNMGGSISGGPSANDRLREKLQTSYLNDMNFNKIASPIAGMTDLLANSYTGAPGGRGQNPAISNSFKPGGDPATANMLGWLGKQDKNKGASALQLKKLEMSQNRDKQKVDEFSTKRKDAFYNDYVAKNPQVKSIMSSLEPMKKLKVLIQTGTGLSYNIARQLLTKAMQGSRPTDRDLIVNSGDPSIPVKLKRIVSLDLKGEMELDDKLAYKDVINALLITNSGQLKDYMESIRPESKVRGYSDDEFNTRFGSYFEPNMGIAPITESDISEYETKRLERDATKKRITNTINKTAVKDVNRVVKKGGRWLRDPKTGKLIRG